MTSQLYLFNDSDSSTLNVSWKGRLFDIFKSDFTININNNHIDTIKTYQEMESGKTYALSDRSIITIRLIGNRLRVTHNEEKIQPQQNQEKTIQTTYNGIFVLGAFRLILGILTIIPATNGGASQDQIRVQGYTSLIFGLLFLVLSPINKKTRSIALHWLTALLILTATVLIDGYSLFVLREISSGFTGSLLAIAIIFSIYETVNHIKKQD